MRRFRLRAAAAVLLGACLLPAGSAAQEIAVGSKSFTENVILGELTAQLARGSGTTAVHRRELGGTQVLWNALRRGEIDLYPEYAGTIREEILAGREMRDDAALRAALGEQGIRLSEPLGFNNSYALGMKEQLAEELGIRTTSDLRSHAELRFGFSNEFMDRGDGWPSLRDRYRLPHSDVRGLDHDLAYRGLESGAIQVTDLYSTDAEIRYYGLRVLEDDLGHFPAYDAVLLYRGDLLGRAPEALAAVLGLEGRISAAAMIEMNGRTKLGRVPEARVAADFLAANFGLEAEVPEQSARDRFLRNTRAHLLLVAVSLTAAILIAVPLGIVAAKFARAGQAILGIVGIIQTIPSLALLVFMIPLLGIGDAPAIVALFLYSLLPIVRNTYAGLHDIPLPLRESAAALGLPAGARLWRIELPMASRAILAGIKTSAVINV
ncbi:MAG: glycine betaine ABC transporter substrate-binding protein, partial [Gammaproteobacteria bacterium]